MTGSTLGGRSWLTAKGYRALGHQVPDDVDDNEAIVLRPSATPRPANRPRRRFFRRSTGANP